jgi:proliferating cell nuclear antigen
MFSIKLNEPRILSNTIGILSEFITEANFHFEKEGIKLIAMDPANISMVVLTIFPSAFTEFRIEKPSEITVNLEAFKQALKRAKPVDTIALSLEKNKLKMVISGKSTRRFYIPLLEREGKERKIPALDFMATVEIDANEFRDYIDDVSIAGDTVTLDASKNVFTLSGGDVGSKVDVELVKGNDALIQLAVKDPVKSIYSVEYLKKMAKAAGLFDTAILQFSKDYPLKLEFRALNKLQMSFILAPRIDNQ